jgi:hypothetical protein
LIHNGAPEDGRDYGVLVINASIRITVEGLMACTSVVGIEGGIDIEYLLRK